MSMSNTAPEKIYLFENPIDGTPDYRWLSKRSCSDDVEYVRKDAFVDKAATWFANRYQSNGSYLCADDIEDFIKTTKESNMEKEIINKINTTEVKEVQGEAVSENLEEAAQKYVTKEGYLAGLHYNSMVRAFKAGAEWYASHNTKQPDNLLLAARKASIAMCDYDEKYLDEYPYDSIAEQKFIEGANWQKEQLKAKDGEKDESKEVDFDAEWKRYFEHRGEIATVNVQQLAKHFYNLGLKAQKGE